MSIYRVSPPESLYLGNSEPAFLEIVDDLSGVVGGEHNVVEQEGGGGTHLPKQNDFDILSFLFGDALDEQPTLLSRGHQHEILLLPSEDIACLELLEVGKARSPRHQLQMFEHSLIRQGARPIIVIVVY